MHNVIIFCVEMINSSIHPPATCRPEIQKCFQANYIIYLPLSCDQNTDSYNSNYEILNFDPQVKSYILKKIGSK